MEERFPVRPALLLAGAICVVAAYLSVWPEPPIDIHFTGAGWAVSGALPTWAYVSVGLGLLLFLGAIFTGPSRKKTV